MYIFVIAAVSQISNHFKSSDNTCSFVSVPMMSLVMAFDVGGFIKAKNSFRPA